MAKTLAQFRSEANPVTPVILTVKGSDGEVYVPISEPGSPAIPVSMPLIGGGGDCVVVDDSGSDFDLYAFKTGGTEGTVVKTLRINYKDSTKKKPLSFVEY